MMKEFTAGPQHESDNMNAIACVITCDTHLPLVPYGPLDNLTLILATSDQWLGRSAVEAMAAR